MRPTNDDHQPQEDDTVGGFTLDELGDYLDRGCQPCLEEIESSPEAMHALAQLRRIRDLTVDFVSDGEDVDDQSPWWQSILSGITAETRAGRHISVHTEVLGAEHFITEGALKALIRDAGDAVPGALLGRIVFDGDVSDPHTELTVAIQVMVRPHTVIPTAVALIRQAAMDSLSRHTTARITAINVTIVDVLPPQEGSTNE